MGFELMSRENKDAVFVRGKPYGDFLAKWIRIEVHVNKTSKEIKVCSPFIGILFDTGDLWEITSRAISEIGVTNNNR